jgi:ribosomal protein L37E
MRCPECGGYSFDDKGVCSICGYNMYPTPSRKDLGMVDIYKLAEGLEKKTEIEKPAELKKDSKLETCPRCGQQSLMYNKFAKKMECLNKYCPNLKPSLSKDITEYFRHSHDD